MKYYSDNAGGFTPLESQQPNGLNQNRNPYYTLRTTLTGFTFIEVIIVMAILAMVFSGVLYVVISGQETFDEGAMTTHLESEANRLIDIIKDDINECLVITSSVPTTSNNYASLTIKVPVQVSGNYWDPITGAIYWGANNTQDWYIVYRFEYIEGLSEPTLRKDYNRDGDISDSFDLGEMVKYVYNAVGTLQDTVKLGRNIITVATDRYLDINNNGVNDPIFTLLDKNGRMVTSGGNRVRINIWLGGLLGAQDMPIIINCKTDVALLNPQ